MTDEISYRIKIFQNRNSGEFESGFSFKFPSSMHLGQVLNRAFKSIFKKDESWRKTGHNRWDRRISVKFKVFKEQELVFNSENDPVYSDRYFIKGWKQKETFFFRLFSNFPSQKPTLISENDEINFDEIVRNSNVSNQNIYEALIICSGVLDKKANAISSSYFQKHISLSKEEKEYALGIAKNVREKYGDEFVDYVLNLKKLPFGFGRVDMLHKKLSNNQKSIGLIDAFGNEHELTLIRKEIQLNKIGSSLKVQLDCNGRIKEETSNRVPRTTLILMMDLLANFDRQVAYFGYTTGKCAICKRELTDKTSLQFGYGKRCAELNGLIWE